MGNICRKFFPHLSRLFLFPVLHIDSLQKWCQFFIHIILERMFQIQMIDWIDQTLCLPFCQQISSRHHQKKDPYDVWKKLPNCWKHIINSLGGTKNRPILQSDRIIERLLSKCIGRSYCFSSPVFHRSFDFFSVFMIF